VCPLLQYLLCHWPLASFKVFLDFNSWCSVLKLQSVISCFAQGNIPLIDCGGITRYLLNSTTRQFNGVVCWNVRRALNELLVVVLKVSPPCG
jgi:hypothetical protein